jgi:hypothetical protein
MPSVHREIHINASPASIRASWEYFLRWVRTSQHRLACDELGCTDAVGSGAVRFEDPGDGGTVMTVDVVPDSGPSADVLSQQVIHDLLLFKDYIERERGGKRLAREGRARLRDDERHNEPARRHLSKENHNAPAGGSYTDHYPT